jgi:hypothetical protein
VHELPPAERVVTVLSFTQPICPDCYDGRYPGRLPTQLVDATEERCCDCGLPTHAGVYIRVDPATVPHPTKLKDG